MPIRSVPSCGIVLAGEQPHQVRLAGAVRADQPDPLAEVDLLLERAHEPVDGDVAQRDDDPRRVAAADPHADLLVDDRGGRRAGVDEPLPAVSAASAFLANPSRDRGPLLHDLVELEQPALLALPLHQPVAEPLLARLARLRIGRVGAAVQPGAVRLEREDRVARRAEQVAVVADQQHRLARRGDPRLELQLGGDVEEVVGLVEQQHLRLALEQDVEHEPLALAARELRRRAPADVVERRADDPPARRVPLPLELVAAELGPVRDRLAEPHAGPGGVRAGVELALRGEHPRPGVAQPRGRRLQQQLAHGAARVRPDADVLGHVREGPDVDVALRGRQLPGEDAEQRRLADAVGTHQPDVLPGGDLERDLAEQQVAAGVGVGEVGDGDVRHAQARSAPTASRTDSNPSRSSSAGSPVRISRTTPGPR